MTPQANLRPHIAKSSSDRSRTRCIEAEKANRTGIASPCFQQRVRRGVPSQSIAAEFGRRDAKDQAGSAVENFYLIYLQALENSEGQFRRSRSL